MPSSRHYSVALVPGDGIGTEVIPEAVRALEATAKAHGFSLDFTDFDWSCERYHKTGRFMPEDGMDEVKRHDAILLGAVYGMVPATIAELLPTRVRCSGAAIGYNACLGLIAGTAPLLSTWLVARTGDVLAPAWYLIVLAGVHLIGWAFLKEKAGQPLGGLHDPVPAANPGLVSRIGRMFDALRPGQVLERFNWTVQASDARFTPSAAPLKALAAATPDEAALDVLYMRVERQTISKLPKSGLLLFTIRIAVDPLRAALSSPQNTEAFREAWGGTAPVLAAYKGWPAYERLVRAALASLT